jgi:hypothetical protein
MPSSLASLNPDDDDDDDDDDDNNNNNYYYIGNSVYATRSTISFPSCRSIDTVRENYRCFYRR